MYLLTGFRLPKSEKVDLTASGEDKDGNYVDNVPIQATVDSVQIADDLQLLNGQIPEGWEDAVGEDGKLKENTISYIREGDGVDSLDEVVKTKTEQQNWYILPSHTPIHQTRKQTIYSTLVP